jgi:hypothetical protein
MSRSELLARESDQTIFDPGTGPTGSRVARRPATDSVSHGVTSLSVSRGEAIDSAALGFRTRMVAVPTVLYVTGGLLPRRAQVLLLVCRRTPSRTSAAGVPCLGRARRHGPGGPAAYGITGPVGRSAICAKRRMIMQAARIIC